MHKSMNRCTALIAAGVMLLALFGTSLQAQNFVTPRSVLDAAGGEIASANYGTVNAVGQPGPSGASQSSNYQIVTGFLAGGGVNFAPQISTIPDQQMDEGDTLDVPVTANDPNNHMITLSAGNLPPFGSFTDNGDGTGTFEFTPGSSDAGSYAGITVTAQDNGLPSLSDSLSFTLTVDDVGAIDDDDGGLPKTYALRQNYPNPFNPTTTIRYELPTASDLKLTIYDVQGRQVRELASGRMNAGRYQLDWNGQNDAGVQVASGVYLYRIRANDYVLTRKMLLVR